MSGKKDKKKKNVEESEEVVRDEAAENPSDEDAAAESGEVASDEDAGAESDAEDDVDESSESEAAENEEEGDEAGGPPTRRMLEDEQPPYGNNFETEPHIKVVPPIGDSLDPEMTLNLTGDALDVVLRDDSKEPSPLAQTMEAPTAIPQGTLGRDHLKGLLEALIFASDKPLRAAELAKSAAAPLKEVNLLLQILKADYSQRGVQLDEVAGGWIFRTSVAFAPFVRDMAKQKPVRLTRAQVETLAILAYRQPITRPEIDDIRGVDCGPVLKLLLERDLVKILGKKDEPGRPILYGTTSQFLEFFGLKSLKDLPTLREFTELNDDSKRTVEKELGDVLEAAQPEVAEVDLAKTSAEGMPADGNFESTEEEEALEGAAPAAGEEEKEEAPEETEAVAEAEAPASSERALNPDDEAEFPDDDDADFEDDDDDDEDDDDDDDDDEDDEEEVEEPKDPSP
jgi:segregation and condensation protein B